MPLPIASFRFLTIFALLSNASVAHECWLAPDAFALKSSESAVLRLRVGMNLEGQLRDFSPDRIARLSHHSLLGTNDLTDRATSTDTWLVPLNLPGAHVLALDTKPSRITLEAEKFNHYLAEEGLDHVLAARAAAGTSELPGRERYRRCNKTIVHVDASTDAGWSLSTGQRLELTPLVDPATLSPGGTFSLRLHFDAKPLAGVLVRAWHRPSGGELTLLSARSDEQGLASFVLPHTGMWMTSAVHMIPLENDSENDWDSYWGNLTFAVPVTGAALPPSLSLLEESRRLRLGSAGSARLPPTEIEQDDRSTTQQQAGVPIRANLVLAAFECCDPGKGEDTCACEAETKDDSAPAEVRHPLKGVVQSVVADRQSLLVKHEEIPGVMRAMTMMLQVAPAVLTQVKAGDAITARLYRNDQNVWSLDQVTVRDDWIAK